MPEGSDFLRIGTDPIGTALKRQEEERKKQERSARLKRLTESAVTLDSIAGESGGAIRKFFDPKNDKVASNFVRSIYMAALLDADDDKSVGLADRVRMTQRIVRPLLDLEVEVPDFVEGQGRVGSKLVRAPLRQLIQEESGIETPFSDRALTRLFLGARLPDFTDRGISFDAEQVIDNSKVDLERSNPRQLRSPVLARFLDSVGGEGFSQSTFEAKKPISKGAIPLRLLQFLGKNVEGTLLGDVLDVAARGGIGVAGTALAAIQSAKGDLEKGGKTFQQMAEAFFAEPGEGISSPGAFSFREVLDELGMDDGGLRVALGTALDVFTDPIGRIRLLPRTRPGFSRTGGLADRVASGEQSLIGFNAALNPFKLPGDAAIKPVFFRPKAPLAQRLAERTGLKQKIPDIPTRPDVRAAEAFEGFNQSLRQGINKAFSVLPSPFNVPPLIRSGTPLDDAAELATIRAGGERQTYQQAAAAIERKIEEAAEVAGISFDEALERSLRAGEVGGSAAAKRARQQILEGQRRQTQQILRGDTLSHQRRTAAFQKIDGISQELSRLSNKSLNRSLEPDVQRLLREQYFAYRQLQLPHRAALRAAKAVILHGEDAAFAPYGAQMSLLQESMGRVERIVGGKLAPLGDSDLYYIGRVLRPEVAGELGTREKFALGRVVRRFYADHPNMAARSKVWEGLPIPEVEKWIKANRPDLAKKFPEGFFTLHPEQIMDRRSLGTARVLATSDMAQQAVDQMPSFQATKGRIDTGYVRVPELLDELNLQTHRPLQRGKSFDQLLKEEIETLRASGLSDEVLGATGRDATSELRRIAIAELKKRDLIGPTTLSHLEGQVFDAETAAAFRTVTRRWIDPNAPATITQLFDAGTAIWKTYLLAPFSEFHVRNFGTDINLNYLGGVTNPKDYFRAVQALRNKNLRLKFGNWEGTGQEFLDRLRASGVLNNEAALEFGATRGGLAEPLKDPKSRIPKTKFAATEVALPILGTVARGGTGVIIGPRAGRNLGNSLQTWAKATHVVAKLREGFSWEEAALSAKFYLGDYHTLDPFTRQVGRRIFPFMAWYRHNLPLQVKNLLTKPGKATTLAHVTRGIEASGSAPVDHTLIPPWIRDRWYAARRDDDGKIQIFQAGFLGIEDLSMIAPSNLNLWLAQMNPLLKLPFELGFDHDLFKGAPVSAQEFAPSVIRHMPKGFRNWLQFRAVPDDDGEIKYFRADPFKLHFLRSLTPGARAVDAISRNDPAVQQPSSAPNATIKGFTGASIRGYNPLDQDRSLLVQILEKIREQKEDLVREGVLKRLPDGKIILPLRREKALRKVMDEDEFIVFDARRKYAEELLLTEEDTIFEISVNNAERLKLRRQQRKKKIRPANPRAPIRR